MTDKKISLIIPVYNTYKHLEKCINSVLNQSYKNLEIIFIDDASPDESINILEKYKTIDDRIKIVRNKTNMGLYHSRLIGFDFSTGDYIQFLDSDDFIGIDFCRLLIQEAEDSNSDIVTSRTVLVNDSTGEKLQYQSNQNNILNKTLKGADIISNYFKQEGNYFFWHTIWNKIYTRDLFLKSRPHFSKIKEHTIMTEDLAFSSVLMFYASKISSIDYDGIFYLQTEHSSTGKQTLNSVKKNIADMQRVFSFVENFMKEKMIYDAYKLNFLTWKARYAKIWTNNLINLSKKNNENLYDKFIDALDLNKQKVEETEFPITNFEPTVKWDPALEKLRELIINPSVKIISFDIFDTLISRPFLSPTDLFWFMEQSYLKMLDVPKFYSFKTIRVNSEALLREEYKEKEDITLSQIYAKINSLYKMPLKACQELMKLEVSLEVQFCSKRNSIKELYDLALSINKPIILISDMYLESDDINKILNKNNYTKHKKLYVSSEIGKTKWTGNLFNHVIKDLNVAPSSILHIGDTWDSDHQSAIRKGLKAFFIPKAIERLLNHIPDKETGNALDPFFKNKGRLKEYNHAKDFIMIRCMMGMTANIIFDNPYRNHLSNSNYSGNREFLGFLALGWHLLSTGKWLIEDVIAKNKETLHFVSRDGHPYKLCYDLLRENCYKNAPQSNYLYLSRKSLSPILTRKFEDLYHIHNTINIFSYTPKEFAKKYLSEKMIKHIDESSFDFSLNKKFKSLSDYFNFIETLAPFKGNNTENSELTNIESYFQTIGKNDAMFDIGYNGTSYILLSSIKKNIDNYVIHTNYEKYYKYTKDIGNNLSTYYNYKPTITGHIREFLVSKSEPSCIGYKLDANKKISPELEKDICSFVEKETIDLIQANALNFVEEFLKTFKPYFPLFNLRKGDASILLEEFLHFPEEGDTWFFNLCKFEDENAALKGANSLLKIWMNERYDQQLIPSEPNQTNYNNNFNYNEIRPGSTRELKYIFYKWQKRKINSIFKKMKRKK